jgi:2-dehydropantoate 2-reductase
LSRGCTGQLDVNDERWPTIAVLGAGAVGCYFGGMLARAGAPVTLIGRARHIDVVRQKGLCFESQKIRASIPVSASTDVADVRDADLVLFSVKTVDTEQTARQLLPHLKRGAIVTSLQNGVDNVDRIRSVAGIDAVSAVVYVAAEMTAPGCVRHTGRGDLIVGPPSKVVEAVAGVFQRGAVPCLVSDNIQGALWMKLITNCAYNAVSALTRTRYGRIMQNAETRHVVMQAVEESIAVADAAGVRLPEGDARETVRTLGAEAMVNALSSTAQDIVRGKHTEIDSLNGYVVRRGRELGVATPINQALYALVKLLEEGNGRS